MRMDAPAKFDFAIFEYLYRDAANYKAFGSILLSGSMAEQEAQRILDACESGLYFIAEQIGIPSLYTELYQYSGGPTEDDHVFHEFLQVRSHEGSVDDQVWGSVQDLLNRFAEAKGSWNYSLSPHWQANSWL